MIYGIIERKKALLFHILQFPYAVVSSCNQTYKFFILIIELCHILRNIFSGLDLVNKLFVCHGINHSCLSARTLFPNIQKDTGTGKAISDRSNSHACFLDFRASAGVLSLSLIHIFIRSIFVGEGLLIGGLGASIGAVLGVGFCLAQQHFGMIRIPVDTLLLYSYPVEMRWSDLLIVAAAFGAVILAISELTVRSVMKNNKL